MKSSEQRRLGLVSIIMPSYMTGKYIKESIKSVIDQTYEEWELIIVDDCSKDNTDEIIQSIFDRRIKYIKQKCNAGAAACRNRALNEAQGKWIAFLDSDDVWHPQKLEKQICFMVDNNYSFSYTDYMEMDERGNPTGTRVSGPSRINKSGMYNYCWPGCLTVMYSREVIGLIQIPNIIKNNDYALWLMAVEKANCYLLKECLALYRRGRENSISSHSCFKLIYYHYLLFRVVVGQNVIKSGLSTVRNIVFGLVKKLIYVKKLPPVNEMYKGI